MPPTGSTPRGSTPREWTGLTTPTGFERCVRATLRELYGYVALLSGRDRREAERTVGEVYRSLFLSARAGHVESVTLGALRSAARRMWFEEHRAALAAIDEVSGEPASVIADLSVLERAVLVLRHVNGMSVARAAAELGRREQDVTALGAHAVRRLRGTDDTSGAWLRAYLGPTVTPTGGLVDRIVRDLGAPAAPVPPVPTAGPIEPAPPSTVDLETAELPAVEMVSPRETTDGPSTLDLETVELPAVDMSAGEGRTDLQTAEVPVVDTATPGEEPPTTETPIVGQVAGPDADDHDRKDGRHDDSDGDGDGDDQQGDTQHDDSQQDPAHLVTTELPAVTPAMSTERPDAPAHPPIVTVTPTGAVPDGASHRSPLRWIVPISAVVIAALAIGVWLILRSDSAGSVGDGAAAVTTTPTATTLEMSDATATTSTVVPVDPAEPTESTVAPTTTEPVLVAPPTSTAAFVTGERSEWFEPACEARIGEADPTPLGLGEAAFGPLAAEPGVSLTLPVVRSATGDRSSPAISTVRVDDGVLMVLEAIFEISDVTDRIMSYVGLDGTVAWTRCLTDDPIVLVQPTGQVPMTVGRVESEGAAPAWYPIDLDDGSLGEPYEGITERAINASLRLEETEVRTEPTVEWRFADGSWLLTGMDADGRELWTDPDAEAPFGDAPGFRIGVTDGTALVATCAERPDGDPEGCAAPGPLVAYDVDTGEQRWSIDADLAPVVADGFALARSEGGWDMIDVADGTAIAGQHWDESSTFAVAGGLDGASVFLRWLDGVLVAAHGDRLDLWLPTAFAAPTVEVSIP